MYNTKQRDIILKIFKDNPEKCFSAKDIINNPEIAVGEATVYRSLSRLAEDLFIRKFSVSGGSLYQYNKCGDCSSHFHLKCTGCGNLIHMDCHLMSEMVNHIESDHDFILDSSKTTLYGICENCRGKKK